MKNIIFDSFNTIPYFTIESAKQLFGNGVADAGTVRTALYRWTKTGQLIQLKKGIYMPRRFYELHRGDSDFSAAISAILEPQSYVSLEFILQRFSVLSEVTYPVSAITHKNTHVIENTLGTFAYRHIQEELFHGFTIVNYFGILVGQASVAKALFDFLYLRNLSGVIRTARFNVVEELRLNLDDFSPADRVEFSEYVLCSGLPKMERILANFRRTVWQR